MVKDSIEVNGELRSNVMTIDKQGKVILIALTMRPGETTRIISMRRASTQEREIFAKLLVITSRLRRLAETLAPQLLVMRGYFHPVLTSVT